MAMRSFPERKSCGSRPLARPVLEALEARTTPSTISWINPAGGAWDDPANWDLGRTPQPDDDVVIRDLDFGAVVDHAAGTDTVQSVSSALFSAILAVTDQSSLTVSGSANVANLKALTGGVVTANNTGSLKTNLRAESGGEIYLPELTEYVADIFTNITATGPGSLIDLPAVAALMATTGGGGRGETRLDFIADQGGTINLPVLTSVVGHPPDYFVGNTALRASNGGTYLLDTNDPVTFTAGGSLNVDPGTDVQAGALVVGEGGSVAVDGTLEADSILAQGEVTVSGALTVAGDFTVARGTTDLEHGTVVVGGRFASQGGFVFGSGEIDGNVINAGWLSIGSLTINGDYSQTAAGQLSIRLRSATDFDQLVVTGFASLDGTLDTNLASGYHPQAGDQLQVIEFGAGTGAFSHLTGNAPLFGVLYVYSPRPDVQPGVTLLF